MKINSEQEMFEFGQKFAKQLLSDGRLNVVIELIGDVGAGKTTFARGLASGLGISTPVTSPSFTISKSYAFYDKNHHPHILTHYDFYRLKNPGLMSENLNESITNDHLVIIEWANTVQNFLPKNRTVITITLNNDGSRNIEKYEEELKKSESLSVRPKAHKNSTKTAQGASKNHAVFANSSHRIHLSLDTSTPTTILKINHKIYQQQFGNTLSQNILTFIHDKLQENNYDWPDIEKITFMSGPGSFTGLRIGASVVNVLSRELNIPLYDHHGRLHKIILPNYGHAANITKPKK